MVTLVSLILVMFFKQTIGEPGYDFTIRIRMHLWAIMTLIFDLRHGGTKKGTYSYISDWFYESLSGNNRCLTLL